MKCKIKSCDEPVFGALHMPIWKKNKNGKVITNINGNPIREGYELWHYCKEHYEIYSFLDNMIDKTIEGLDRLGERILQERYETINALFALSSKKLNP